MTNQLKTPLTHRLIESPPGRLLYLPLVERLKVAAIDSEFTVLRARAIADVAGTSVKQFCEEAKVVFEEWGVPATNFTEWDCGHFGVLLWVMRSREFQHLLTNLLDEPRLSSGVTTRRESR